MAFVADDAWHIIIQKMKSSLHLSTNTPLHKEELTKVKTIWRSLQDHNDSIEFRNPVNYKGTIGPIF